MDISCLKKGFVLLDGIYAKKILVNNATSDSKWEGF